MTERKKMLAGKQYDARDPELQALARKARRIMRDYTNFSCEYEDPEAKIKLLRQLFGHIGEGVMIEAPFFCDYGAHVFIGNDTFINFNATFLDCNTITIGKGCLIAPNVQFYAVGHPVNPDERHPVNKAGINLPHPINSAPITVGDNVWIGGGSIILQGVTIGDGTTIGAGSVVTKSIPSRVLAAGNPCKVIRQL